MYCNVWQHSIAARLSASFALAAEGSTIREWLSVPFLQLDNPDPALAQAVIISYSAFLDANMWMGFGYSSNTSTSVRANFHAGLWHGSP